MRDLLDELHASGGGCPAAIPVRGAADAYSGCICGVVLNDSRRRDSILEGALQGVFIAAWSDPSTLVKWCFGDGLPQVDPDAHPEVAHYTTCPVWLAEQEIHQAMERLWGETEDPRDLLEMLRQLEQEEDERAVAERVEIEAPEFVIYDPANV